MVPDTLREHIRGTDFSLTVWVYKNGKPIDLTLSRYSTYFAIAEAGVVSGSDVLTPVVTRQSPSADITGTTAGKLTIRLAPDYTKRTTLPLDAYRLHVSVTDSGVSPTETWCVSRGPLSLLPSPQG